MNTSANAYIFLDTNTALHFRRPDQIDWSALVNASEVILVAAPIFLRELEREKVHNSSSKLRKRADRYVRWLNNFVDDPSKEVRPSVRWCFLPHEPQIDFVANSLSPEIADDRLIASVLTYTPSPGATYSSRPPTSA